MAIIRITRAGGEVVDYKLTPSIEYAFELAHGGSGTSKVFRETEGKSVFYWLAWEALRSNGVSVPLYGPEFIKSLEDVDVIEEKKAQ